jgi:glycosyltransferase involved in cell wall biosynthesis
MGIIFDLLATQPLRNSVHGGGEYGEAVFRALLENVPGESITAFYDRERPINEALLEGAESGGVELVEISRKSDVQQLISSLKTGTFYSALPYQYFDLDFHDMRVVLTIHGLRPIEIASDRYEYRYSKGIAGWSKWAAKTLFSKRYVRWRTSQFGDLLNCQARELHVVVPSKHTKYSLLNTFPEFPVDKIRVLYSPETAVESDVPAAADTLSTYGLSDRSFIMLVSGNRWVKNSYRALAAIEKLSKSIDIGKQIVIVGGSPKRCPAEWQSRFRFLPYVSKEDLVALYKSAYCLLYPTLNEGFGYPPLEAMRHGTPVLCSAITSTTEILGDAPLYFSPYSTDEIQNRILCLIRSGDLWERKRDESLARYRFVSSRQREMLRQLVEIIAK